jgi:hypothetical protein
MDFLSWTSANHGVQKVTTEVGRNLSAQGATVSSGSTPQVAKDLKSSKGCAPSKHSASEFDHGIEEGLDKNTVKGLKTLPRPRAESSNLEKADLQKAGKGFVPAWRRKSFDEIRRIRSKRQGESS